MKNILTGCAVFLVLLASASVHAVRVKQLNLAEMSNAAEYVFEGQCVNKDTVFDTGVGQDIYVYTFRVDRVLKGDPGDSHEVRVLKSLADQNQISSFEKGEKLVLFLYGESRLGFSSPVGLGQGRFKVRELESGKKELVNEIQNRGLFNGMQTGIPRALPSQGSGALANEGPIDYDIFMGLTEELVNP